MWLKQTKSSVYPKLSIYGGKFLMEKPIFYHGIFVNGKK